MQMILFFVRLIARDGLIVSQVNMFAHLTKVCSGRVDFSAQKLFFFALCSSYITVAGIIACIKCNGLFIQAKFISFLLQPKKFGQSSLEIYIAKDLEYFPARSVSENFLSRGRYV